MNGWIATKEANGTQRVVADFGASANNYMEYEKDSDVRSPATTWYLIDEHEKSINDVLFLVAMPTLAAGTVDVPATRHNRGYGLSFCDGHSEIYKLRNARTTYPLTSSAINNGNSDYAKLQNVTTVHK